MNLEGLTICHCSPSGWNKVYGKHLKPPRRICSIYVCAGIVWQGSLCLFIPFEVLWKSKLSWHYPSCISSMTAHLSQGDACSLAQIPALGCSDNPRCQGKVPHSSRLCWGLDYSGLAWRGSPGDTLWTLSPAPSPLGSQQIQSFRVRTQCCN